MSPEPVIRHYRGSTRTDAEDAFRAEAAQAAAAGYLPFSHQWTTDWEGFLLAVTYQLSAGSESMAQATQGAPMERSHPATEVAPPRAVSEPAADATTDRFAPYRSEADEDGYRQFAAHDRAGAASAPTQPTYDEPTLDEPAYREPAYEQATYEQPPYEAPAFTASEQPAYEEPKYEELTLQPEEPPQEALADEAPEHEAQELKAAAEESPEHEAQEPEAAAEESTAEESAEESTAEESTADGAPETHVDPAQAFTPRLDIPAPEAVMPEPAAPVHDPGPDVAAARVNEPRLIVQTMDLHCGGEPLRIIRSGFPEVPHLPVHERGQWVLENADHVRRAIIQEPRGHRDMYGAILLPPYSDYADMTVLFMHNEGYSTMCGHGVIAITTGLIEEGLFPATEPVTTIRYEVPAGIVAANAATVQLDNGDWVVQGVRFTNVPSYVAAQSLAVRPEGVQLYGHAAHYGALSVDLAFGGAYYGIVNAAELGLRVVPEQADALRRAGAAITDVLRRDYTPAHPIDPALSFVYGTIIVDLDPRSSPDGRATDAHMRNATIFADAELDRSPCGSGTSAILAQLHARGRIRVGQEIVNAGITGEHFLGRVEAETALGPYPAISTSVAGTAYITGYSTFTVDRRDALGEGFLLR